MDSVLFLTGATGFIGANLLCELLSHQPNLRVIALVRGSSQGDARQRLASAFYSTAPGSVCTQLLDRVTVVRGDIEQPDLGLSSQDLQMVVSETTHIVHSAANINFDAPLDEARRVNVGGTKHLLAVAREARKSGHLQCFGYIGTAYVSGLKEGIIGEDELDDNAGFTNNYERSKHEAECVVRSAMDELPVIIFRPSIVVGHSSSGVTTSFNVLYPPLRMIHRRKLTALPGFRTVLLDVVPVDYVVRAVSHLLFSVSGSIGRTYHLTAGKQRSCSAGEIVDTAVAFFNRGNNAAIPRVLFIPPFLFRALVHLVRDLRRHASKVVAIYQPYLAVHRCFDTTNSTRDLGPAGILPPPLTEYLDRLLQYCVDSNWGKRPHAPAI